MCVCAGNHTLCSTYRCEIDANGTSGGSIQFRYDGEELTSLDLNTLTWTAANDKAKIFINVYDPTGNQAKYWKNYLETKCVKQLNQYVSYRKETVERKGKVCDLLYFCNWHLLCLKC